MKAERNVNVCSKILLKMKIKYLNQSIIFLNWFNKVSFFYSEEKILFSGSLVSLKMVKPHACLHKDKSIFAFKCIYNVSHGANKTNICLA